MGEAKRKAAAPFDGNFIDAFRTGAERAAALLLAKRRANAKFYAGVSEGPRSRQVQRRIARQSVKHRLGREEFNRVKRAEKR